MTTDMSPDPGPEMPEFAYQPGAKGGVWTDHEVASTRRRVFQMIHPNWDVKKAQGTWNGVGVKTKIVRLGETRTSIDMDITGSSDRKHPDASDIPRLYALH